MSKQMSTPSNTLKPGRMGLIFMYVVYTAIVVRVLTRISAPKLLPWYLVLLFVYLVLFSALLWRPGVPRVLLHAYMLVQSAITLGLLSLDPENDFVAVLWALLCYQAALIFTGRTRWMWVGVLVALIGASLMFYLGPLRGLYLALPTMAASIVISAHVVVNGEIQAARATSQATLDELQATHRQLQSYAGQVEELAAMEERNRLARELHDSVSQTMFSIVLNTRSTQILLERDPDRVRAQLEQLQRLTQNALAEMRGLIAQLRPPRELEIRD